MQRFLFTSTFFVASLTIVVAQNSFPSKQLKHLDKMGIKEAIYKQEVNEPVISRILELRRQQPKVLIPGVVLSAVSAVLLSYGIDYAQKNRGSDVKAVEATSIAFGSVACGGSLALYTITIIKKKERNRLINGLKN